MIKWYRFKNFYSYPDDTYVDLTVDKKASPSYFDVPFENETISKILVVFGANASGKSNLLRPMAFLKWFFLQSFHGQSLNDELPFYPFFFNKDDPSEIEVCFTDLPDNQSKNEYKYYTRFTKQRVITEELKIKTSRQYSTVFKREYDQGSDQYLASTYTRNIDTQIRARDIIDTPSNSSVIPYLRRKGNSFIDRIANNLFSFHSNLSQHGRIGFDINDVLDVSRIYFEDKALFERVKSTLRKLDLGITDIAIEEDEEVDKKTGDKVKFYIPYGIHKKDDATYEVPFILESRGTQACYTMLSSIIGVLESGGTAIVDELDNELHPMMVQEIIEMFKDDCINIHNAQLIFSCHSPEILKQLKKHHVYIVEKNNSTSEAWRLDEIKGLRSQDNIYTKYITGAIGGIPDFNR